MAVVITVMTLCREMSFSMLVLSGNEGTGAARDGDGWTSGSVAGVDCCGGLGRPVWLMVTVDPARN